jgi:hypothetical protein
MEMPYRDVESLDVTASSSGQSGAPVATVMVILVLLGALLGLHIKGAAGSIFGGLIAGIIGGIIGWAWFQAETNVRLRGRYAEYYFLNTLKRPDPAGRSLSRLDSDQQGTCR